MDRNGKTERLVVRMSRDDMSALAAAASSAGLSKSEYVRSLIGGERLEVLRLDIDPEVLPALLLEMKRQGNNLNQLAMRANRRSPIDPAEVSSALAACRGAAASVMQAIEDSRPHR